MRTWPLLLVVGLLWVGGAERAHAQAPGDQTVTGVRHGVAEEIVTDNVSFSLDRFLDYVAVVASRSGALVRLLAQYEEERSDKQLGATASAAGTTTLASKGTVPKILAVAVENGAATRSQSGTTVTFRSNLGGSVRTLLGKSFFQLPPLDTSASAILSRISVSTSFDASRGSTGDAALFTGDQQQLSQWTVRAQVINRRDPQSQRGLDRWRDEVAASLTRVSARSERLREMAQKDPAVTAWAAQTATAIDRVRMRTAGETPEQHIARVEAALAEAEASLPLGAALREDTRAALNDYDESSAEFARGRQQLLDDIAKGALVTVEYSNDRPLAGPSTSNVRVVGEVGVGVDLTGNAAMTLFNEIPVGATRRLRDFELAGQMDVKLGSALTVGAFILSLAGKWTHQLEDSITETGLVLPDTKGHIATGQLKLTMPVKGSGVKIPLSVTFANRTDLITEKRIIRGNIGLSYDLDAVFARFKP